MDVRLCADTCLSEGMLCSSPMFVNRDSPYQLTTRHPGPHCLVAKYISMPPGCQSSLRDPVAAPELQRLLGNIGDPVPNEHGDVLADGAAALIGGLGLAPSACIGRDYAYFEPVHGTAPDIAGMNIINPTAMILSAKWMLDYLGFEDAAGRLEKAVYAVYAEGEYLTPDQGGSSSTTDFCAAVQAGL